MKVHKIEIMVIDFDDIGAEECKIVLENTHYANRCIDPQVMLIETKEVEWSDEHPLNSSETQHYAYLELFPS